MNIKIGNFNFINNNSDEFRGFGDLQYDDYYFYMDGKEDTLYVSSRNKFDRASEPEMQKYTDFDFQRELAKKYYIIDYNMLITNLINSYIRGKVLNIFNNKNYSKYNLYKNISFSKLMSLKDSSIYKFDFRDTTKFKIDSNKICKGKFIFNPYIENIENLEECYNNNMFKEQIKNSLILKEIQEGVAPKFVYELNKIEEFMKGKKSVNLIFNGYEKFKINPYLSSFLDLRDNKISLNLSYNEQNFFERENPTKNYKDLKLNDLVGLSYGKNVLHIDNSALIDIDKQMTKSTEDKLLLKIDKLNDELLNEYNYYRNTHNQKDYCPYDIQDAINICTQIDLRNLQRESGNLDGKHEEYPTYYSSELEDIFKRFDLIKELEQVENLEDLKDITRELGDNELQQIYYEFLDEEIQETEEDEL